MRIVKGEEAGMKDSWSRPKGAELEENRAAIARMRMLGIALIMTLVCVAFYFGLFIGWKVFGG